MIYILHFDKPYKHARHYTGFVNDASGLEARLDAHMNGDGARIMEVVISAGIGFTVGAILEGDRKRERQLKMEGHISRHCEVCRKEKGYAQPSRKGKLSRK